MRLYDPNGVYTTDQIRAALEATQGRRAVQFKFERLDYLNRSLGFLTYVVQATVSNSALADIKRTANFTLRDTGALNYLSDRIKPYMGLQMLDGGYVWWPQGVFLLSTPSRTYTQGTAVFRDVDGYDQLQVLKDDRVLNRYTVNAGTNYTDAIQAIVSSTVTNYATDPSGEAGTGTFNPYYSPTTSYDTTQYLRGTKSYKIVTNSTSTPGGVIVWSASGAYSGAVTASVWVKGTLGDQWVVGGRTNGPYNEGQAGYAFTTSGNWQRISVTYTVPDGTQQFGIQIRLATATSGNTLYADAALLTTGVQLYDFFDGANGGNWGGTANASVSQKAIPNFALAVTPTGLTLPNAMEWDPGTTKLQIVNDLLSAINYKSATFDEDGTLVCAPYIIPSNRAPEYTYANGSTSLIRSEDVTQTLDYFAVPNVVVLVKSDPEADPLIATATNYNPASPTSTVNRARSIVEYNTDSDAADQATLQAKATATLANYSQIYEEVTFSSPLMPIHQDMDVYNVVIDGLSVSAIYAETQWSMDLVAGGNMKHTIRRVVQIA